jgi:hypothetical protein
MQQLSQPDAEYALRDWKRYISGDTDRGRKLLAPFLAGKHDLASGEQRPRMCHFALMPLCLCFTCAGNAPNWRTQNLRLSSMTVPTATSNKYYGGAQPRECRSCGSYRAPVGRNNGLPVSGRSCRLCRAFNVTDCRCSSAAELNCCATCPCTAPSPLGRPFPDYDPALRNIKYDPAVTVAACPQCFMPDGTRCVFCLLRSLRWWWRVKGRDGRRRGREETCQPGGYAL